jgi:hypothetical protein
VCGICGDGACGDFESCVNCPADCGACPDEPLDCPAILECYDDCSIEGDDSYCYTTCAALGCPAAQAQLEAYYDCRADEVVGDCFDRCDRCSLACAYDPTCDDPECGLCFECLNDECSEELGLCYDGGC